MRLFHGVLIVLVLLAPVCADAEVLSAKVTAVVDGDTVHVSHDGKPIKVRLLDIDAPEMNQPFGDVSRNILIELVLNREIELDILGYDEYGRALATLKFSGVNINEEMVRRGAAWEYYRARNRQEMLKLRQQAQQEGIGLWSDAVPVNPYHWRKQHPNVAKNGESRDQKPGCGKRYCSQMNTCDEALDYFNRCGIKVLDGDGNGIPCEQLCARQ